ncbi:MAG: RdgB/HAM1 family non-canonical purine NTP pyrophosphatase [Sphingomonas sp.]|uniref:RdgB/HAM1 family non-canonical purine NTP pyrophosphatase n=1 Tax=Sphingomonas sp. TaxID=28214 RepID=UPI000DB82524|nr:RdgB/HAM1 family non-canonical purine NTP pyrophosphatase [Sphingomonas sp.]PZP18035.1 MAG: non-canonical purine NTP pyrophosphatase, RdgB/HAM1 family [Sphingomonas hengshuiensis]
MTAGIRKLAPGRLVIATHNAGKLREMTALLAPYGMETVSVGVLGLPEPDETGTQFAENAAIKAHSAASLSGLPALADDSGLCVAALGGEPGVYTANWAETADGTRDWTLAMTRVHDRLAALGPEVSRAGTFVSTLALAWPDGDIRFFEGRIDGTLVWPPRGDAGFGYDPMFVPLGETRTFAEMTFEEKQANNHRARAFAAFVASAF